MKCCDICGHQSLVESVSVETRSDRARFGETAIVIDVCHSCAEKVTRAIRAAVAKLKKASVVIEK